MPQKIILMVVRILCLGLWDLAKKGIEKRQKKKAIERVKKANAKRRREMSKRNRKQ